MILEILRSLRQHFTEYLAIYEPAAFYFHLVFEPVQAFSFVEVVLVNFLDYVLEKISGVRRSLGTYIQGVPLFVCKHGWLRHLKNYKVG